MDTLPKKICAYCQKPNEHIWSGKKLKDGSKVYTNKKNQRWAGKRCPICEHERVRNSLKVDAFKKNLILKQLIKEGYTIKNKNYPITVIKDQTEYSVGIKQGYAEKGIITFENESKTKEGLQTDFYALLFQTVRIISKEKLQKITQATTRLEKKTLTAGEYSRTTTVT